MRFLWGLHAAALCLCFLVSEAGRAQDIQDPGIGSSIGFRAGYGFPQGAWGKSRVAPNVQQFGGSIACEGDIAIRLGGRWSLALGGGYAPLSGSTWEEYTFSKGEEVNVSASIAYVSLLLRPYLTSPPDLVALEIGPVGLFAGGNETVDGVWYNYDFFNSFRLGFQGGLEYDRVISKSVALTAKAGIVVVPSGITYADGESRSIIHVPVTAGIRFLF